MKRNAENKLEGKKFKSKYVKIHAWEIAEINRTSKSSPGLIMKSAKDKITKIPSREHGGENKTVNTRSLRQRKSRRLGVQSSRSEKTTYKKNKIVEVTVKDLAEDA